MFRHTTLYIFKNVIKCNDLYNWPQTVSRNSSSSHHCEDAVLYKKNKMAKNLLLTNNVERYIESHADDLKKQVIRKL